MGFDPCVTSAASSPPSCLGVRGAPKAVEDAVRVFEGPKRKPPKPKWPSWGKCDLLWPNRARGRAECYDRATVLRESACPIANTCATSPARPTRTRGNGRSLDWSWTFCGDAADAVVGCPDYAAPILWQAGVCNSCIADTIMTRFAAVKHQRTVALARDMSAAADAIVKLRSRARREQRHPAELRAEELAIREKFGLLEDTPLHDVTRRGSPLL